jgi:aspartate racemase
MLIATNTMHKVADQVQEAISVPLLHIADAAGREIQRRGHGTVALLGTSFTMREDFYRLRLKEKFGVEVLIPEENTCKYLDGVIFGELCKGVFTSEAHRNFLEIMDDLSGRGAEAAVLGCTEIPLLIKPDDTTLGLIDTTTLHAEMAVDFALETGD